jgi:hypothetical protein
MFLPLESSGHQCQDKIKHPLQHFSFLEDAQMLLHILQGREQKAIGFLSCMITAPNL